MPATADSLAPFAGIPADCIAFLRDLAANNDRDWYQANKGRYESSCLKPALDLITALQAPLAGLDPPLSAIPKMNGSLRRLHRDVRFSKNKRPFAPRLHMIFWAGSHPMRAPGVHIVIAHDHFGVGAGHWAFQPPALARYRAALDDPKALKSLASALAAAEKDGCTLDAPALKRLPRGIAEDHRAAAFFRHKGLVVKSGETGHPDGMFSENAAALVLGHVRALHPLVAWIAHHVGE